MTAIHGTAYPRLRSTLSDKELEEIYPPHAGRPGIYPPRDQIDGGHMRRHRALKNLATVRVLPSAGHPAAAPEPAPRDHHGSPEP